MKILAKERKEMREIFQRETTRLEREDRKLHRKNDQLQRQNDEQKKEMEKQSLQMAQQSQQMAQQSQEMKQLKAKLRQSLRQKATVSVVSFEVDHRLTMSICSLCPSLLVLILFLLFPSNGTLNLRNISSAIMSLIFKS